MAKIHVIYDPNDRIEHNPQILKRLEVKVAMLTISDESLANIGATAETLTCLLLNEVEGGSDRE